MGALKAIDKVIMMGAKADGNLVKAAAQAHHQAIGSIDANSVTSLDDFTGVIASVPKRMVMDVYNSMASLVAPTVPNNLFASVNPLDAQAAAKAFYQFKDVVQASQVA